MFNKTAEEAMEKAFAKLGYERMCSDKPGCDCFEKSPDYKVPEHESPVREDDLNHEGEIDGAIILAIDANRTRFTKTIDMPHDDVPGQDLLIGYQSEPRALITPGQAYVHALFPNETFVKTAFKNRTDLAFELPLFHYRSETDNYLGDMAYTLSDCLKNKEVQKIEITGVEKSFAHLSYCKNDPWLAQHKFKMAAKSLIMPLEKVGFLGKIQFFVKEEYYGQTSALGMSFHNGVLTTPWGEVGNIYDFNIFAFVDDVLLGYTSLHEMRLEGDNFCRVSETALYLDKIREKRFGTDFLLTSIKNPRNKILKNIDISKELLLDGCEFSLYSWLKLDEYDKSYSPLLFSRYEILKEKLQKAAKEGRYPRIHEFMREFFLYWHEVRANFGWLGLSYDEYNKAVEDIFGKNEYDNEHTKRKKRSLNEFLVQNPEA